MSADVINQITKVRLPGGITVAFVDWQDKPLYSTIDFLDAFTDTVMEAFTYLAGDEVPATTNVTVPRTSTERDTNIATPASMASTEEMLVYAIKPEVHNFRTEDGTPTSLADLSLDPDQQGLPIPRANGLAIFNFLMLLHLVVSQKVEQGAPFGYFNTGFGPYGILASGAGAAAVRSYANPGLPSQEAVRAMVLPVHIGGQEKYSVQLRNPTGAPVQFGADEAAEPVNDTQQVYIVRIILDGLYKRPVS